jgi:pimeloyl-ACP methyl ester carboxylesterase
MLPSAATLTGSYSRINCATAIIAGRDDQIVESEQAKKLQNAIPHATVTIIPDLGHMLHYFVTEQIVTMAKETSDDAILAPKRLRSARR